MNETIVLYHGGCRDGFCAAWVVNKYFSNILITNPHTTENIQISANLGIQFIPAYYGQEPPDVTGRTVIIVDFCYPLDIMKQLIEKCASFVWLDHHKTAQPIADWLINEMKPFSPILDKVKYDFDNNRSGAGIVWDYFLLNEPRPWLVDYVEDRDLWLHKLPSSHEVNAYIACLEFNFSIWDSVNNDSIENAETNGKVAIMKTEQYVREVCKNVYFIDFPYPDSHNPIDYFIKIPIVNICQVDCSEVMENLLILYPESQFSLYWFKRQDGMYQYGMRSRGEFDVSTIAKLFGGGGHKNAAGFQLNYLLEELK